MLILKRPWTGQPQGAVGVDWANPLAARLRILINGAAAPVARDVVTGAIWTPEGAVAAAPGPDGVSIAYNGTNCAHNITGYGSLSGATGTFFAWLPVVGPGDPDNPDTGMIPFSSAANVYFQIGAGPNLGKTAVHGGSFNSSGPAISWFNTTRRSIVMSSGGTAASLRTFVDGVDSGQRWTAAPGSWEAGARAMQIGGYAGGTWHDVNGQILIAGYAARIWTEIDARAFHRNPWQLFAPRSIYIPTAAAASGLPTLSASTYVPGSLTSTGWRPQITAS